MDPFYLFFRYMALIYGQLILDLDIGRGILVFQSNEGSPTITRACLHVLNLIESTISLSDVKVSQNMVLVLALSR